MASVSRFDALWALKKADWFGLSWGYHPVHGPDAYCAAAWLLIRRHGPDFFELRGDVWFPKEHHLSEALDTLAQVANWAEVMGFVHRTHFDETITDVYVWDQERVSQQARDKK